MSCFVSTLGLTLVHFLWQGTLICVAAALALRLSAKRTAQVRYLICMVALVACTLTPCVTALVLMDDPSISSLGMSGTLLLRQIEAPLLAVRGIGGSQSFDLISLTVVFWVIGVLAVGAYYAVQWRAVERIRRSAGPLLAHQRVVAERARKLLQRWPASAAVPMMIARSISTPLVVGFWRPMIVFPAAMLARMPVADFELILLHEIAHIVRRDGWANTLQVYLEIVFFYHPCVHWLSRRARLERERACDDFAIAASGSKYQYARALASLMVVSGRVPATAFGAAGADLLPRLQYLTGKWKDHDEFPRSPSILALIALLLLGLGVTTLPQPWGGLAEMLSDGPGIHLRVDPVRVEWPPSTVGEAGQRGSRESVAADSAPASRATAIAPRTRSQPSVVSGAAHGAEAVREAAPIPLEYSMPPLKELTLKELALQPQLGIPNLPDFSESDPSAAAEPLLTAIYSPLPEYPGLARLDAVEGTVSVVVRVAPDGRPSDLQIVHAEPLGVFEGAVRRALMKWRYNVANSADPSAHLTASYQLRFSIAGVTSDAAPVCVTMTASNTCRPL